MNKRSIKQYVLLTAIIFLAIVLSACSTSPTPNFYILEQEANLQLSGIEQGLVIGLEPVNIAPYLDRPHIVTRTGNHKLELSEFNRWVESLKDSVSRVVAVNLSNSLKTNRVYLLPRHNKTPHLDYQITIDIVRFDGQLGGNARLTARWSLYDKQGNLLIAKVSIITEPTSGEGYEYLVAAENRALKKLTLEISDMIKNNP